jgi:uncharacterized protein
MKISKKQARFYLLSYHKLLSPRNEDKKTILGFIKRVGCIQYDPLNIAGRNADLVLQSRFKDYKEHDLYDLLYNKRKLIDYWDKNMSILPSEHWPYFKRTRTKYKKHYEERKDILDKVKKEIINEIKKEGFINSGAFKKDEKIKWSWAPTNIIRAALESMFHSGELIIHHKNGTRKFYAFPQKHLPDKYLKSEDPNKSFFDYCKWYVLRRIKSVGMLWNRAGNAWLGINDFNSEQRTKAFDELLNQQKIIKISIKGINHPLYVPSEYKSNFENTDYTPQTSFIAPLDNLIWDRKLVKELFGFEYTWEVYTPAKKRKYGYYVLPVLYGDRFIARFEPVLNKLENELIIKNWWWEKGESPDDKMITSIKSGLNDFLKFTGMQKIIHSDKISSSYL